MTGPSTDNDVAGVKAPWPRGLIALAMSVAVVAWVIQLISGYRPPWSSIVVSDGDSGAAVRQVVFALGGVLGAAWLLGNARLPEITRGRSAITVLLGWALASTVYSAEPVLTIKRSLILAFCNLLLAAMVASSPRPMESVGRWLTIVTAASAWLSVAGSVVLPAECWSIAERPGLAGLTGHPNQLGGIVGIGIIVSLGVSARGLGRMALIIAQIGLVLALLMSKSMTCLTFTVAGIAIHVAMMAKPTMRAMAVVIAIPLVAVTACIGVETLRDDALAAAGKDASLSGRTELWSVVGREIRERPMLGSGYGAFWREQRGRELVGTWNPRQSHQAYLDLLLDLGIVGVVLVAAIVFCGTLAPMLTLIARGQALDPQRAALVAMVLALCCVYALGESFMLKADKFPFFAMLWSVLAMTDARSLVESAVQRRQRDTQQFGSLSG